MTVRPRLHKICPNCGEQIFIKNHFSDIMGMYRCVSKEERVATCEDWDEIQKDGFEEGPTVMYGESTDPESQRRLRELVQSQAHGYHVTKIVKGEIGEISKIQEELDELKDAASQGVKVMELVELSDLIGAVEAYLERRHPGISLEDLTRMKDVTRRAFRNGHR